MKLKPHRIKIAVTAVLLLVLYLFSRSIPTERAQLQIDFDNWLTSKEASVNEIISKNSAARANGDSQQPTPATFLPTLTMQVGSPCNGTQCEKENETFSVGPSMSPGQQTRIFRLLQLMRESDIFSIGAKAKGVSNSLVISIRVTDGATVFNTRFQESDVQNNTKALLLFKLFKEFADQPVGTPGWVG